MKAPGFRIKVQCAECPWRKDVPPGKFSPERFNELRNTYGQGFRPLFACHMSPEQEPDSCVGYLLAGGMMNWNVRMAAARGEFNPEELRAAGPLFGSYDEMAVANGCAGKDPDGDEPPPVFNHKRPP